MLPDRVIRCSMPQEAAHVAPELWHFLGLAEDDSSILPAGPLAVPLASWQAKRESLAARRDPLGVWLEPQDDPALIASDLAAFAIIAVRFPRFTDGRGYSIAALLRTRHGYKGELRAIGDVGRDQLFYLKRCGFDSFALPPHRDPEAALAGLDDFRERYQGSVDEPLPLFRRRHG